MRRSVVASSGTILEVCVKARIGVALAMTLLLSVGTAGCAFITPQATTKVIEAANGVNGQVGTIGIRNATLISDDDGKTASLLVSFYNSNLSTRELTVQYEADGALTQQQVFIAGGGTTSFGAEGEKQVVLTGLDAKPGSLFPIYFQYGDVEGKQLFVPMLTTVFAEYKGLAPTPVPTVVAPTGTPAPGTTDTTTPTVTPTPADTAAPTDTVAPTPAG
jgi:hypothetical protein